MKIKMEKSEILSEENFDEYKIKDSSEGLLEGIVDKIKNFDPTLSDLSYEPSKFSHSQKWKMEPFRDPKTGALVTWALPYAMPHGEGWKALGVYKIGYHQWEQDRTDDNSVHTYHHEQGHAKGYTDENLTDQYAESQSNGYYSLGA